MSKPNDKELPEDAENTNNVGLARPSCSADEVNKVQSGTVQGTVEQMEKPQVAKKEFLEWWKDTPKDEPAASIDAWKSGWDAATEFIKQNACPPPTCYAMQKPFGVYENYEGGFGISDGQGRVVLDDAFAYDQDKESRLARMEWIAEKLNA